MITMTSNNDVMHRNHFVAKTAKDALIDGDELYKIQIARYQTVKGKIKKVVAEVNCGKAQFLEISTKYGLGEILAKRWKIWDTEAKEYVLLPNE